VLVFIVWLPGVEQFVLNDPPKAKLSKFDGFCNFARKSFGSSFEHLFKVCCTCRFLLSSLSLKLPSVFNCLTSNLILNAFISVERLM